MPVSPLLPAHPSGLLKCGLQRGCASGVLEVRIIKKLKGSECEIETGAKQGTGDWRGSASVYTAEDSRKYPACQLLYWYRSNEVWKSRLGRGGIINGVSGSDT